MARKRRTDTQEQPAVNRIQSAFEGGKTSIPPSVRRKMKEQAENGDLARLNAPPTADEVIAAKVAAGQNETPEQAYERRKAEIEGSDPAVKGPKYGSLLRVSDEFADEVRKTAANIGTSMGDFCDKILTPLVRSFRFEVMTEELEKLKGDYKATLHLRSLLSSTTLAAVEGATVPVRFLTSHEKHKAGESFDLPAKEYSYLFRCGIVEPVEPTE